MVFVVVPAQTPRHPRACAFALVAVALLIAGSALAVPIGSPSADTLAGSVPAAASSALLPGGDVADFAQEAEAASPELQDELAAPVLFEPNLGQEPDGVLFSGRFDGAFVALMADRIEVALPDGSVSGVRFVGSSASVRLEGEGRLPSYSNHFLPAGSDPVVGVPHYSSVLYRGLYPGIDVRFYPTEDGGMEFDYLVAAGADPSKIRLASLDPVLHLSLAPDGGLLAGAGFFLHAPVLLQAGERVDGRYVVNERGIATFEIGAYDRSLPLVIDPKLGYSSYFGGDGTEVFTAVKGYGGFLFAAGVSNSANNRCIASPSASVPFPPNTCPTGYGATLTAAQASMVVAKFDLTKDGYPSLVWIARIAGIQQVWDIDVDATGIYLTGSAGSGMPLTGNAYQVLHGSTPNTVYLPANGCSSAYDAFLVRLSSTGMDLLYSSYLGGQFQDHGYGVVSTGTGDAVVVGAAAWTNGFPFPTKNAFQANHNGPQASYFCLKGTIQGCFDAFVAKFDTDVPVAPTGVNLDSLLFSTLVGSGGQAPSLCTFNTNDAGNSYPWAIGSDVATDVVLDAAGDIWVSGHTSASAGSVPPFPTAGTPFVSGGGEDAFLLKLSKDGALLSSTFLGGSGLDRAYSLALGNGNVYLAGVTDSTNFPTNGPAYRTTRYGGSGTAMQDAFVASVDQVTGQLMKSTYLGSPSESIGLVPFGCTWNCAPGYVGNEVANSIQVDLNGIVHVQGITDHGSQGNGPHFPRLHAWPGLAGAKEDLFAASFTSDLGELLFATAVGSVASDVPVDNGNTRKYGFPPSTGYASPGHYGMLLTDALGTENVALASGMPWPAWQDLKTTWDFDDGLGTYLHGTTQQYLVHGWNIQPSGCPPPPPPSPWATRCYNWPADGHLQWNITITVEDLAGNKNSFTKPLHLIRCGASFAGGVTPSASPCPAGVPCNVIPQSATPYPPNPEAWPTPTIRLKWTMYDSSCIGNTFTASSSSFGFWSDSYPTAGGIPIERSASHMGVHIPELNSFHRDNYQKGMPTTGCCGGTLHPPDATIARFVGPSEPFVVCGTTTAPPHYRGVPIGFTWAPADKPHTQGIETYSQYDSPLDPDWGMDLSSFQWDFDYDGSFDPEPSVAGQVTPSYVYPPTVSAGLHTVRVEAKDTDGNQGFGICTVELTNRVPNAFCAQAIPGTIAAYLPVTFTAAASSDPDGYIASYAWDFPGADPDSSDQVSATTKWTVAGFYTVTLTVTDNDGAQATATCDIEVHPNPAVPDDFIFNEDEDARPLAIFANDSPGLTLASWTMPTKGQLWGPVGSVFWYRPLPDMNGADSFTYQLTDGTTSFPGLVGIWINPVNDPPAFSPSSPVIVTTPDEGPYVGPGWARSVRAGPWGTTDEAWQAVTFELVSNSHPQLFAGTPTLQRTATPSATNPELPPITGDFGILRFAPSGAYGKAELCFRGVDDGGTATVQDGFDPTEEATGVDKGASTCFWVVQNRPPVAYFEPSPARAAPGQAVAFDPCPRPIPSCSHDPDGTIAGYHWDFGDGYISHEAGPIHVFAGPGAYTVRLTVKDEHGASADYLFTVTVAWPDAAPVAEEQVGGGAEVPMADAGENRTVREGTFVQLVGSHRGGGAVHWHWLQLRGPTVKLENASSPHLAFTAPLLSDGNPVELIFALWVSDGAGTSAPDYVGVWVVSGNHAPEARAGPAQAVAAGALVTLDGSGHDPDGDAITFAWEQLAGPAVSLSDVHAAAPTFVAPAGTEALEFRLRVSDGKATAFDDVQVLLNPREAQAPARFTYEVRLTPDGAEVRFKALGGTPEDAVWEFDDGTSEAGPAPTHHFAPGTYDIRMRQGQSEHTERIVIPAAASLEAVGFSWLPFAGSVLLIVALAALLVHFLLRRAREEPN